MTLLVALALCLQDKTAEETSKKSEATILADGLVNFLTSDRIEEREQAFLSLKELGLPAIPALEKALKGSDRDLARLADSLVRVIRVRREIPLPLLKALPGTDERIARGEEHAWMEVLLEAMAREKRTGIAWTADELAPMVRRAIPEASTDAEQEAIRGLVVGRKIRSAVPELVEAYLRQVSYVGPFVQALEQMRAPESIPPLLRAVVEGSATRRIRAAYRLGALRAKEASPLLIRMLRDPDPEASEAAAWALCGIQADEALSEIASLLESPHLKLRVTAALVLPGMGAKGEAARIARLLDDSNPVARRYAAAALGDLGAREAAPRIRPLLHDPDRDTRWFASSALGKLGDSDSIGPLMGLMEDPESRVRWAAAKALGQLRAKDALPRIRQALEDRSSEVRQGALDALVHFNDPGEARYLLPLLKDEDKHVRRSAIGALVSLGDDTAAPAIADRLGDSDPEVAGAAAEWFCLKGRQEGIPTLLSGTHRLWTLNLLRFPKLWNLLDTTLLPERREARVKEHLELLARGHGLVLEWSDRLSEDDYPWSTFWTLPESSSGQRPLDALTDIVGDGGELILERDRLRVVPPDEAFRFWTEWWRARAREK